MDTPDAPKNAPPRGAGQRPAPTARGGQKKLANGLIALSSAAVIAVYAAGYARTAPAAGDLAAAAIVGPTPAIVAASSPSPTMTTALPTATSAPTSTATTAGATATPSPAPSSAPRAAPATAIAPAAAGSGTTAATTAAYKDGTYTGTGTSRHGSIGVTLTVQGGKITAAAITDCGTRYPCSRIADLPGQVVARQAATVDVVSGATDSTTAYRAAVAAALAKARV